jgi:hypothetical protein
MSSLRRSTRLAELRDELLGSDGAVALVDPRLEHVERYRIAGPEGRRHPAAPPEPVVCRLTERELEGSLGAGRQLHRETQPRLVLAHEDERLGAHLDGAVPPREVLVRLGVGEGEATHGRLARVLFRPSDQQPSL